MPYEDRLYFTLLWSGTLQGITAPVISEIHYGVLKHQGPINQ